MLARLGDVLYWIGCVAAALFAIGGIFAAIHESNGVSHKIEVFIFFEVIAAIAWFSGKACRYIMRGNQ